MVIFFGGARYRQTCRKVRSIDLGPVSGTFVTGSTTSSLWPPWDNRDSEARGQPGF